MSSNSIDEGEVQHYAYMVLRTFPHSPTEMALIGLLTEPFLIEAAISFTNRSISGCILLYFLIKLFSHNGIMKTFWVAVEFFYRYKPYCDRYNSTDEIVYFPINYLS